MISELANLPDISFIENKTLTEVQAKMVADFQSKYKELTGQSYKLMRADPVSLALYGSSPDLSDDAVCGSQRKDESFEVQHRRLPGPSRCV